VLLHQKAGEKEKEDNRVILYSSTGCKDTTTHHTGTGDLLGERKKAPVGSGKKKEEGKLMFMRSKRGMVWGDNNLYM